MSQLAARPALNSPRLIVVGLLFSFSLISYFRSHHHLHRRAPINERLRCLNDADGRRLLRIHPWLCSHDDSGRPLIRPSGRPSHAGAHGIAFSAVFTALIVFSGNPGLGAILGIVPALFVIRLGLGIVTAPLYPACARMTANWIPVVYHARVQGFIIAGSSAGAAISGHYCLPGCGVALSLAGVQFLMAALVTAGARPFSWLWYARDYPPDAGRSPRGRSGNQRRRPGRRYSPTAT